jgi:MFS family permease
MTNPYQTPNPAPTPADATAPQASLFFYYGWVIVVVAAVAMAATLPGRTHGLGMITKPLIDEFKAGNENGLLSKDLFAQINLWATLIGALFCLPCGWMLDRFGLKNLLGLVLAGLAAVVIWMSFIRDVPSLVIAITLTRGIGQSMLSVVSITMIGKWFQKNISISMGIYSVLMGMLMGPGSKMLNSRITEVGWREAWWELGILLLVTAPLAWLATRNRPVNEELEFGIKGASKSSELEVVGASLLQALASPCFWVFAGSISFFGMVSSGISLFQQYVLAERFSEQLQADPKFVQNVYGNVLLIGFLVGMVTNLVCGGLAKIVRLQWLLGFSLALYSLALGILPLMHTEGGVYLYAVIQGIGGGMMTVLFFAVWGHAFGTVELGRIQGAAQMMTVVASACGPLVVERAQQLGGSYERILFVFAGIAAVFAVVSPFIPVPNVRAGDWAANSTSPSLALAQETSS